MWKEVRVYDSASLEEWLEQAPAVNAWLGGILGKKPPGITVIDDYWANLQAVTDPSLKPEVFLASREEQVKELDRVARWPARRQGDRGTVANRGDRFRGRLQPGLIASGMVRCTSLDRGGPRRLASLGVVRRGTAADRASVAPDRAGAGRGSRTSRAPCLASLEPDIEENVDAIKLPGAHRYDLEKALVSSGLDEEKARRRAREAGGSLAVLKRLLGRLPGTIHPGWSEPPEALSLVPMLLAGSWDDNSEADRSAMARLSGHSYESSRRPPNGG